MTKSPKSFVQLEKVRWLTIKEISELWAPDLATLPSVLERELQLCVFNLQKFHRQGLTPVFPGVDNLPPLDTLMTREELDHFCEKQGWPWPKFWFANDKGDVSFPGRPSIMKTIVQKLESLSNENQLEPTLAEQGNITGQSVVGIDLTAKRFELLREIVPQVSRVGLLFNPAEPSGPQYLAEGKAAAAALGLTVLPFELGALNEMESVFARMVQAEVQALALGPGGLLFQRKENLAKLPLAHRMPACGWSRETLLSGLLLSYGPDLVQIVRQAATFVDKILHGAKPGDIPVQQPTRFQLIVNQRTAKALNINIPASFFLRSDEVVE